MEIIGAVVWTGGGGTFGLSGGGNKNNTGLITLLVAVNGFSNGFDIGMNLEAIVGFSIGFIAEGAV
jgi:hypothetical protein